MKRNVNTIKIIVFSFGLLFIIFLLFFAYKKIINGNNESNKSAEEIQKYILDIKSYEAEMEITVKSNKNTNKYLVKQQYVKDGNSKQTVLKPENIEGMEFEYKDNTLILNNSKLNISKVYNDYPYLSDNVLWLSSFSQKYNNSKDKKINENDEEIIMEVKSDDNEYYKSRKLYLEKGTGRPKKMEITDSGNNCIIYISYNEISINK